MGLPDGRVSSTSQVRQEVETKAGRTFDEFTPLKYRTQLVNGVNYFVKASSEHCIPVRLSPVPWLSTSGAYISEFIR